MGMRDWLNWLLRYRDQETVELAEGIHLASDEDIQAVEQEIADKRAEKPPEPD
jgi:hypothetical protein